MRVADNVRTVVQITRHMPPNYGSVLQAMATEWVLRRLGYEAVTIDYRRAQESTASLVRRYSAGKSLPHKLYRHVIWRRLWERGEMHFARQRRRYLTLSKECDESSLSKVIEEIDPSALVTGSDQVWNVLGDGKVDGSYFWSQIPSSRLEHRRLVSYSASFGTDAIAREYERTVANWLARYDAVSVREDSGVRLLRSIGIEGTQVPDPSLLLPPEEWRRLEEDAGRFVRGDYALVYNLYNGSVAPSYAERHVQGSGLDLVSVCSSFRHQAGRDIRFPSIGEFIWLIDHASCVYTNSFHGACFCANLSTPFVPVYPEENSARNESLLRLLGLEWRESSVYQGNAWDDDIDWPVVSSRLESERRRGVSWLSDVLGGA